MRILHAVEHEQRAAGSGCAVSEIAQGVLVERRARAHLGDDALVAAPPVSWSSSSQSSRRSAAVPCAAAISRSSRTRASSRAAAMTAAARPRACASAPRAPRGYRRRASRSLVPAASCAVAPSRMRGASRSSRPARNRSCRSSRNPRARAARAARRRARSAASCARRPSVPVALVEMEVVARQRGDVHQAVDLQLLQLHEQAEVDDAGHDASNSSPMRVLHVHALEPGDDATRRLVRAPLAQRALVSERRPSRRAE